MMRPFAPIPTAIALIIGLAIWFVIPVPDGVAPEAWHLLAIFVATIAAIIGKAMGIGALAMIGITLVAITGVTNPDSPKGAILDALSGFSNPLIWLIGLAMMISRGLAKTGLGNRIGYAFISIFGKRTLGIGYALTLAELTIAPITPSNTARGGAIIHPIMRSIADSFGSSPEQGTSGRIGHYLALVNYHANPISSAMFITATAPNPLIVDLISKTTGGSFSITWTQWALAALVPGLVALLVMPLALYFLYPPELKRTPDATQFARDKLGEMGPLSGQEWIMIGVFAMLLLLWAGIPAMLFGPGLAVNATTVALLGLSILLISGVLTWDDVLKEKSAWDTIVWFSALVMMASFLGKLGLISWFSGVIQQGIASFEMGWFAMTLALVAIFFYTHYFFASVTAHVTAMFGAFLAAGIALGIPTPYLALMMAGASSLMMSLTHYATGTAPIIYGSGYIEMGAWWKAGFIMSLINLAIWITVGSLWWKVLGYW
ncbi:DASS family sodium-coupled anion symporter [Halomonas binhaiensis]|uniref:DASS family sodium-coupled anion symporter n=1 Tax=Halomonas binhaiensis TaxID=2562282 RepID=A0A5C1NM64_9GAMM|nr:DASS family sodium-coupled anion symporter [Halomonas binhaiensis]QEM83245.1 DASS family sodium-coupled anion symporter [Halomonas binhaiensis]